MKIKLLVALALSLFLYGCDNVPSNGIDQCLRAQLFKECLEKVPKGPDVVNFNDWRNVVSECESASQYQSVRLRTSIKQECLSN